MPEIKNIRFQKLDEFNNPVFIVSSDIASEKETYDTLKNYYIKLFQHNYGTFLPIYHSPAYKYATIRFKSGNIVRKYKKNDVYNIVFSVKKSVSLSNKTYIKCYINSIVKTAIATTIDEEDLDLDD